MTTDFVHRFLPASDADSQTTLLLLHGTGGDERDLIPLGQSLMPGAAILSPRGKVLERGMPRFFRRFAEGVFDVEDLKFRAHELAQFIDDARMEYHFPERMIAVGYSNGANIAAGLMLLHPGLLSGGVLLRVMVPFVPESAPALSGTKVLLAAGRQDPIIPPSGTMQLSDILTAAGADVTLHWHDGGHELGEDDIEVAREWLRAWKPATTMPRP
jgi:phospholipase/carboxylesterase/glyoxalase family protein